MKALSDTDKQILTLVAKTMPLGATPIAITGQIGHTRQNTNWFLLKLTKRGFLVKSRESMNVYYRITPEGYGALLNEPRGGVGKPSKPFTPKAKPQTVAVRAHAYGLAYNLRTPLFKPEKVLSLAFNTSELKLINNTQAFAKVGAKITARLTTKKLELFTKDIYTTNRELSLETEAKLKEILDEKALEVEARLRDRAGFSLVRIKGSLYSEVVQQHWAYEQHPISEALQDTNIVLARHPRDKKQRLIMDMSKGVKEAEAVHRITGSVDKDVIDQQFNMVLDGEIDLRDINRIDRIELALEKYANNELVHLAMIKEMKGLLKKITDKQNQRRLP